jgi:hypothetical protein
MLETNIKECGNIYSHVVTEIYLGKKRKHSSWCSSELELYNISFLDLPVVWFSNSSTPSVGGVKVPVRGMLSASGEELDPPGYNFGISWFSIQFYTFAAIPERNNLLSPPTPFSESFPYPSLQIFE